MARSEQEFIELCKKQIEKKFSFGNGNGYTQRDLEILSNRIEEKTGVNISLSTLKRLWKNNYKQSPQIATLNALAEMLDHKDWLSFKEAYPNKPNKVLANAKWVLPLSSMVIGLILILSSSQESSDLEQQEHTTEGMVFNPIEISGPVIFSAQKTVTSGIPNTVIFNYDLSNVKADSFFIQQSWNRYHRVSINPKMEAFSSIYYESGYHRAKLIANDSLIAMQPIHILSNGWEPHLYYNENDQPIDFKQQEFVKNGQLHLDSTILATRNVDYSKHFFSRISNSQQFGVHSDDFTLSARVKLDSVTNSLCPWMNIIIVTEVHIFRVSLQKKGCEKYASYKLGEITKWGEHSDLSSLGCSVYDWQDLQVKVKDKHASIILNGETAYEEYFKEDFGEVVGLIYIFDGTGSIDYTKLQDDLNQIVFEDNFEREN